MKNILFLCSKNKLRSPTAEAIFCTHSSLDVRSAGLSRDAEVHISVEDVQWAEIIFVMENKHKSKLQKDYKPYLFNQKIINLGIPDNYQYMDEALIQLLNEKVKRYI